MDLDKLPHNNDKSSVHIVMYCKQNNPVTGKFEKSAPNDPKMTLNTKRSKIPHRMSPKLTWALKGQRYPYKRNNYPRVPIFTQFCSSRFQVTDHFDTSAPIDNFRWTMQRSRSPYWNAATTCNKDQTNIHICNKYGNVTQMEHHKENKHAIFTGLFPAFVNIHNIIIFYTFYTFHK